MNTSMYCNEFGFAETLADLKTDIENNTVFAVVSVDLGQSGKIRSYGKLEFLGNSKGPTGFRLVNPKLADKSAVAVFTENHIRTLRPAKFVYPPGQFVPGIGVNVPVDWFVTLKNH